MAELLAKWGNVVQTLKGDKVEVVNPDHALEGALSIRCACSYGSCTITERVITDGGS